MQSIQVSSLRHFSSTVAIYRLHRPTGTVKQTSHFFLLLLTFLLHVKALNFKTTATRPCLTEQRSHEYPVQEFQNVYLLNRSEQSPFWTEPSNLFSKKNMKQDLALNLPFPLSLSTPSFYMYVHLPLLSRFLFPLTISCSHSPPPSPPSLSPSFL